MKHKRVIEPIVVFFPVVFVFVFIICLILMILISKITILGFLIKYTAILGAVSFVGIITSLVILFHKKKILSYMKSIYPTISLHKSLKVYPKISDFKNQNQKLNCAENEYNCCIQMSYFRQTSRAIKIVIPVPINLDAQLIMDKKLSKLRKDIVAKYTNYTFGEFEQEYGFMILQGNHD